MQTLYLTISVSISQCTPYLVDLVGHIVLVSSIPPSFLPVLHGVFQSPRGGTFNLDCIMSDSGAPHLHPYAARGSLSDDDCYEYSRISLRIILLMFFPSPKTNCVWPYPRSPVSSHPSSVGHGLPLVVLASSWTSLWLATLTRPQIIGGGQIIGRGCVTQLVSLCIAYRVSSHA